MLGKFFGGIVSQAQKFHSFVMADKMALKLPPWLRLPKLLHSFNFILLHCTYQGPPVGW
jgi:hypothetical protein